ncbi:MAG: response regulator transcription factor [Lachnospiraceae bacterium]|nr:response regulator transcription factor [Lachnospiraceae bacterium]
MRIYICDDEEKILQDLSALVNACCPESRISSFSSGKELIHNLYKQNCDILLLDIDMPEINGMEVAKELSNLSRKPLLVFITSHDELVYQSFQYHPFGFIRKRFYQKELPKLLLECMEELKKQVWHFCFREDGKDIRMLLSEIFYFEADGNYLKLFAKQDSYRFRSTLTAVENTLQSCGFIRIHKGFLVNQEMVKTINSEEIELLDKTTLPVGKTYAESARKQFMRYMR